MNVAAWRIPLGFGALGLAALPAAAVTLGDIEVRSRAGAPLEARIPVVGGKDEVLRGACFSLAPRGAVPLPAPTLELRRSSHGAALFVRTREPVAEGAAFAIAVACPHAASAPAAEYAVRFSTPAVARPPAATTPAAPLPVITSLGARAGDTLASLARAIFPGDGLARARYLQAIRAENERLAAVGDDEPLAPGTAIALPDLHAFAGTMPAQRAPASGASASRPIAHAPAATRTTKGPLRTAAAPPAHEGSQRVSLRASNDERRQPANAGFQLRLSAPVMDLAPSRGMDERKRAELRDRLLVLEADDRTAAMLAMRENIRRLESQVSELKLKLAAMPSPTPASSPHSTSTATKPKPQPVETPPKAQLPKVEAEGAQPATTGTSEPQPPKIASPGTPSPKMQAAQSAQVPAPEEKRSEERPRPVVIPRAPGDEPWYSNVLWWLRLLLVPLAGVLGLRYFARRRAAGIGEYAEEDIAPDLAVTEPGADAADTEPPSDASIHSQPAREAATRVPADDNLELRRRYIEERFPEIANGAVALDDARSMVRAARLLYDDGAVARAIELLQFALEQDPDAMPAWLALFAIFRLQGLSGEFAELARRFAERHEASDEWRDVRAIGRALDPANPLYAGEEVIAALDGGPDGWLRGPGDAAQNALAGELRSRLMAGASIGDADLAPDPVPALRKAEVFSVA